MTFHTRTLTTLATCALVSAAGFAGLWLIDRREVKA